MKFILAILVFFLLIMAPVIIAFKRKHKFRWIIAVLAIVPSYGIGWVVALVWALWPSDGLFFRRI